MNTKVIKPENYIRLFHGQGYNYFIAQIFMHWYKNVDALVTVGKGVMISFMPTQVAERTKNEGLRFLSNPRPFRNYAHNFRQYFQECKKIPILLRKSTITPRALAEVLGLFQEFFAHYHKTEFFYNDYAYRALLTKQFPKKRLQILQVNLRALYRLKVRGRLFLNKLFLENRSFATILLKKLSRRFGYSKSQLAFLDPQELLGLYFGGKLDRKTVRQRQDFFCIVAARRKIISLSRGQQRVIVSAFKKYFEKSSRLLKGTPANPGKVRGVITVLTPDVRDFSAYVRQATRMKPGTILVAETTSPEIMLACRKAKAIIANQGGLGSHAAIISRELGIPCVVGINVATQVLKNGDLVEVDAEQGVVKILKRKK